MQLEELKGVGQKTADKLRSLGIRDGRDLLDFLPSAYWDMTREGDLRTAREGEYLLLKGRVRKLTKLVRTGRLNFFAATIDTPSGSIKAVWFNAPYLRNNIAEGQDLTLWGKLTVKKGARELINPGFEGAGGERLKGIVPIYPTKGVVGQSLMRKLTAECAARQEVKPLVEAEGLMSLGRAYYEAHCPMSIEGAEAALRRIALEDMTARLVAYRASREGETERRKSRCNLPFEIMDDLVQSLPFELSPSQRAAIEDIVRDMKGEVCMNRMIVGDVGSGKTVVALLTAAYVARCGMQSVLMAPTEILARQHFKTASELLEGSGVTCALITGSDSAAQKRKIRSGVASGETDILIGTHAVLSDDVVFADLGYVIVDELHKFGVRQKSVLETKAKGVDVAVMSATPIPRTLALAEYGDIAVSTIESRKSADEYADTSIVADDKLDEMFEFIRQKALGGEQAYIVCPRVEDSEGMELMSAKTVYEELTKGRFADISVGLVYGSMAEKRKTETMKLFSEGKISVLVATGVVEVGVDCPGASVIAVLHADRFGLASLHQLRGRVGRRSGMRSYCFLHAASSDASRLEILEKECDGFRLAEKDAEIRGYGDFLGWRQSGGSAFKIDIELLRESKRCADLLGGRPKEELLADHRVRKFYDRVNNISMN